MATETLLQSEFIRDLILPFLLVFTLVFAILEKSKLFGEDKKQIDALVALAIGLITVTYAFATHMIVDLMPFLAVVLVIILSFMLMWGFVASSKEGLQISKGIQIAFGILIAIALIIAVITIAGLWDFVYAYLGDNFWASAIFIAVIVAALGIALTSGKKNIGS